MFAIAALVLAAPRPQSSDAWKTIAVAELERLPKSETEDFMPIATDRLRVREQLDRGSVTVSVEGLLTLYIFAADKFVGGMTFVRDPLPYSDEIYPSNEIQRRTSKIVRALLPQYKNWKSNPVQTYGDTVVGHQWPIVQGLRSSSGIQCDFRKSDGALLRIQKDAPLDYSRPFGKLVSKEQAIASAWDAYLRCLPYVKGRLVSIEPYLGITTRNYLNGDAPNEVTAEDVTLSNANIAVPLYEVVISSAFSSLVAQVITVDAQSGRTKVILPGGALAGSKVIPDRVIGKDQVRATIGKTKLSLTLDAERQPTKTVAKELPIVPVVIEKDTYSARLDGSLLWLAGNEQWFPYELGERALEAAKKAVVTGPPFGKKT